MTFAFLSVVMASLWMVAPESGDANQPDETVVYKEVDGKPLEIFVLRPADWNADDRRPAVVFYHGGGLVGGNPNQFFPQARLLADRGMVAFSVRYRFRNQPGLTVEDCIIDAKDAFRFVREHAADFGIDADRIAAGGGSAGGYLALSLALLQIDSPGDHTTPCTPDALILFNPVYDANRHAAGRGARELSPTENVHAGMPPTVMFHGSADTTVPVEDAHVFHDKLKQAGVECELHVYDGQGHGFFNLGRGGNKMYEQTTAEMIRFLTKLGWIKSES